MPSPLRICRCRQCRLVRSFSPASHWLIRKQAAAHRHLVKRLLAGAATNGVDHA